MRQMELLIFGIICLLFNYPHVSEATWCYQCDSWEHGHGNGDRDLGCGEYEADKRFLVNCNSNSNYPGVNPQQYTPVSCIKEVTTFFPGQIAGQLDRNNRFGRPHVSRGCGIRLSSNLNYRQNEYIDGCTEREITIAAGTSVSVQGTRLACSCQTDECNSAMTSATLIKPGFLLAAAFLVHLVSRRV